MATQCVRCGIVLPRDDARFCSKCGANQPVRRSDSSPSSPDVEGIGFKPTDGDFISPQPWPSSATNINKPPADEKGYHSGSRPAIREQIAYRPPARPSRRPDNNEPPAWMGNLEREVVHPMDNAAGSPPRELRVKVWQPQEQSGGSDNPFLMKKGVGPFDKDIYQAQIEPLSGQVSSNEEIEDLPTAHLPAEHHSSNVVQTPQEPTRANQRAIEKNRADELPTGPLAASPSGPSISPSTKPRVNPLSAREIADRNSSAPSAPRMPVRDASTPYGDPAITKGSSYLDEVGQIETRPMVSQHQAMPSPLPPTAGRSAEQRTTPPPSMAMPPRVSRSKRKSRKPFVFMLIVLGLLVVGSLIAWVVVEQPFAVPAVTNTDQPFQSTSLGIALRYPQGWVAHIDSKKGSVSFYDSSHTGQVTVNETTATGGIAQYIKTEESGITGQSNQPSLTFAGASWQQVKGSMVQNGATYTVILLATEHNNRFYSIMQQAPPAAYSGEEQLAFSHMRASFQFL